MQLLSLQLEELQESQLLPQVSSAAGDVPGLHAAAVAAAGRAAGVAAAATGECDWLFGSLKKLSLFNSSCNEELPCIKVVKTKKIIQ